MTLTVVMSDIAVIVSFTRQNIISMITAAVFIREDADQYSLRQSLLQTVYSVKCV